MQIRQKTYLRAVLVVRFTFLVGMQNLQRERKGALFAVHGLVCPTTC